MPERVKKTIEQQLNKLHNMYVVSKAVSDKSSDQAVISKTHYIYQGYCSVRAIAQEAGIPLPSL